MDKKTKILLYALGGIAFIGGGYLIYQYLKIKAAYETNLSVTEADNVIVAATASVPDIDPSEYASDDDNNVPSGVVEEGATIQEAVTINGIVYTGDSNSGFYYASSNDGGAVYDDNKGSMDVNGVAIDVSPSSVVYGYISNGEFVQY